MSDPAAALVELPEDLRAEILACAADKQIEVQWLINIYRRGFNAKPGATGRPGPYGLLGPHDEGELAMAMAVDVRHAVIRMEFGKPVAWLALPATHARHLGRMLIAKADELERRLP